MTRKELIDKLYAWYVEWLDNSSLQGQTTEYYRHQAKQNKILAEDKMRRLNCMSNEQLEIMFVQELIRRESHAEDESQG